MKKTLWAMLAVFAFSGCGNETENTLLTDYVDPFIGTDAHGHTYPGATVPFGMVQLSPDTGTEGWDWCSGYHSSDNSIIGFSHKHLSGTGASDLGDILVMPGSGEVVFDPGTKENPASGYRSLFSHSGEEASPGYYKVYLEDPKVKAELTATARTGFHRYTFDRPESRHLIFDLRHGIEDVTEGGYFRRIDERTIEGWRRSTGWAGDHTVYFRAEFSQPLTDIISLVDGQRGNATEGNGREVVFAVQFGEGAAELTVKVGISAVDLEGAAVNLQAEASDKSFDEVRTAATGLWNGELSKVTISGGSKEDKTVFYTALYHALIVPNLFTDADGRYLGSDRRIHREADGDTEANYTVFSTWDTFRAAHPLLTILQPTVNQAIIRSMLRYYEQSGRLPVWDLDMHDNGTMIGYHSVPIIADAYLKGQRTFDGDLALEAMVNSAMDDNYAGLRWYKQLGYLPSDRENNAVSKAVEYAYDDWVIAQMARELGREDLYTLFIRRAQYYKNHFDPKDGFLKGRNSAGSFDPNFDPNEISILGQGDYTEGNAWHYNFFVPQDVNTHIELLGGDAAYIAKIDEMFETEGEEVDHSPDVSGLIGQYAQGNEPSHQVAYLYSYAGAPWKAQERLHEIKRTMYTTARDGLCGNEDCGQMSAWYLFGAMGFYPVTPASGIYVLGTPTFPEMNLHLENGKTFTILADGVSDRNFYVQSVTWNGEPWSKAYITHEMIGQGGTLAFKMGSKPNKEFGAAPQDRPVARIGGEDLVTSEQMLSQVLFEPYITDPTRLFRESITVYPTSDNSREGAYVVYTLDGSDPVPRSARITEQGITLRNSALLKLRVIDPEGRMSNVTTYPFYKSILGDAAVTAEYEPSAPYINGGIAALTDYKTASGGYVHPGWIGFNGNDLLAVYDLGEVKSLSYVGFNVFNRPVSWILLPRSGEFSFSADGNNYTKAVTIPVPDSRQAPEGTQFFGASVPGGVQARYVRVHLRNGDLPGWHTAGGNAAWMFVDEIIAY